jgi:Ni/Co efflux regulator RcnB
VRKYLISAAILTLFAAPSAWSDPPSDRGNRGNEGHVRAEPNRQGPPPGGGFERGPNGRGPAPQAAVQAPPNRGDQDRGFNRGNRGPAPQAAMQTPPNRGDQDRGFDRGNRGPAPQAAIQAPPSRGDRDRSDNDRRMNFERRDQDNRRAFNANRPENRANPPIIDRQASRDFNRDGRTDFRPDTRRGPGVGGPRHDFSGFRDYHRNFQASRRFQVPFYRRPAGWYSHRWAFGEFLPAAFWARDYWLIDFEIYGLPPPPFGAVWVRVDHDALLVDEDTGEIITVAYDVFY